MNRSYKKFWREKCREQFLDFQERNLSKHETVHAFQKKNASNELNIYFLNKIEDDFLLQTFNIEIRTKPNLTEK